MERSPKTETGPNARHETRPGRRVPAGTKDRARRQQAQSQERTGNIIPFQPTAKIQIRGIRCKAIQAPVPGGLASYPPNLWAGRYRLERAGRVQTRPAVPPTPQPKPRPQHPIPTRKPHPHPKPKPKSNHRNTPLTHTRKTTEKQRIKPPEIGFVICFYYLCISYLRL